MATNSPINNLVLQPNVGSSVIDNIRPHPAVWSIAGSDPCGGAGIQNDIKTLTSLGVHGCAVITALTAQNTSSVYRVSAVACDMVKAQIDALCADMKPLAIKIGMVGDADNVKVIARAVAELGAYTVCDPIIISSSGTPLLDGQVIKAMTSELLPHVDVITPNCAEASVLSGIKITDSNDVVDAANALLKLGVKAAIIKGWISGNDMAQDFYTNGVESFWLTSSMRQGTTSRGTGCAFSSNIAAARACGYAENDAMVIAKMHVNQALRHSQPIGKGMAILHHDPSLVRPDDLPWLTCRAEDALVRSEFPNCGSEPLGFYPIVDSVGWLERLLPLGVKTAQLRIKDRRGDDLEQEVVRSINLGRQYNVRLFINDYWQLSIKHRAYGVHLGQEDIDTADIKAIASSGLRLGVSTHSYSEMARAHALRPSYIAIGPIFNTTLKSMKFAPQGIARFKNWRSILNYPVVAIGGINLEHAEELISAGANSIAVVSDITRNNSPESRASAWLRVKFN